MGLSLFLVAMEAAWLRSGNPAYARLYEFWSKIFALTFGVGVVSGIVMTYQLGTNFGAFTGATGPVLGPLIAVEVLTAFFVEAGFIGVMLFGWKRVPPRWHFAATIMVFLGTFNSAFWILVANSWMHTPAGAELVDGVFVVRDWWAAIFNPSMPYRVGHMLLASYLTTALVISGVSAWHLLRDNRDDMARKGLSVGLAVLLVVAPAQIVMGDQHGLNTLEHQPMKIAAMEGLWETTEGAPLLLFAWPDQEGAANRYEIAVPGLASLILTHDLSGELAGLNSVPAEERPPVLWVFWSFRLMVALGFLFLGLALWGLVARVRGRLYDSRKLHYACVALIPGGFIAILAGWMTTEIGRQPWIVQSHMLTADGLSPLQGWQVALSFALFLLAYLAILGIYLWFVHKLVRKGPPPQAQAEEGRRFLRTPQAADNYTPAE